MKLFKSKKDEKKTDLEKVEERREEVLAQGRKFKYPLQYTKRRIVINTVLITAVVVAFLAVGGWLALYKFKMTDEILYRVTTFVPVSVANVDGEKVRFSDYLMLYRSSISSIEQQSGALGNDEDSDFVRNQYKRAALSDAEEYAFAAKIANERGIVVSDEEVEDEFNRHRQVGGVDRSEDGFLKILNDNFGLSKSEYKRMLYLNLVKAKVMVVIDETANSIAEEVERELESNGGNYRGIAETFGEKITYEETGGLVNNKNIDGGRATEAMKLEKDGQSGRFVSMNGDGYYFVKLIDKTDNEVNFVSIFVPFKEFDQQFEGVKNGEGIKEFITLE
ncbi:MAG: SurA N-terminal domain-containing protein [Candidatus Saccharibacteria bacterium]|nr:SurA N-terminal domain-containing protein [Candidatus Saccharibacteria bacterium]